MKWYIGYPETNQVLVHNEDRHYPLNPCFEYVNHSPDGFSWGYNGSGPAQLAFAICMDVLQDEDEVFKMYQNFKAGVISRYSQTGTFKISEESVRKYIQELKNE